VHHFAHRGQKTAEEAQRELSDLEAGVVDEKGKIKGAIRTDFVLSAEIIVIALGTVAGKPFATQLAVLAGIGLLMTVGVYGFVAGIVKLDDLGAYLLRKANAAARSIGKLLLLAAPWLMRALTVVGTIAMFLVGGGILGHGIPPLHHAVAAVIADVGSFGVVVGLLADALVGIVGGILALAVVQGIAKARSAWMPS
jgi:predicted DNA repair protein MutK